MVGKPIAVLITGLPSSGKTIQACWLCAMAQNAYIIDEGQLRKENDDKDFTKTAHLKYAKIGTKKALEFLRDGKHAILSITAPYEEYRKIMRAKIEDAGFRFFEVYLSTPREECEKRDTRGQYAVAHNGGIRNFAGVSAPYEPPYKPDFKIDNTDTEIHDTCEQIYSFTFDL